MTNEQKFVQQDIEDFHITEEPFMFQLLMKLKFSNLHINKESSFTKRPTGTGKTRFVEYMAWKLSNSSIKKNISKSRNYH